MENVDEFMTLSERCFGNQPFFKVKCVGVVIVIYNRQHFEKIFGTKAEIHSQINP